MPFTGKRLDCNMLPHTTESGASCAGSALARPDSHPPSVSSSPPRRPVLSAARLGYARDGH